MNEGGKNCVGNEQLNNSYCSLHTAKVQEQMSINQAWHITHREKM